MRVLLSGRSFAHPANSRARDFIRRLVARRCVATLATTFPPDRCFTLPLALSARLLVEAALAEFGVQAGSLDLPLEAAQGPIEAFVLLNEDFQGVSPDNLSDRTPKIGKAPPVYNAPGHHPVESP